LWEAFWHEYKIVVCFLLKTLIMPILEEIEEGRAERCNASREIADVRVNKENKI
jgi:hypothetical protein